MLPADVLTGHTADDQAETVLINLLRGAGASGLAAMRPGPTKPLLALRRAETVALCADLGLDPVIDPSNADRRFLRNRVREEVLPLLCDVAKRDVVPLLLRTGELLRDDDDLLDELAVSHRPLRRPRRGRCGCSARPPRAAQLVGGGRLRARSRHAQPGARRRPRRGDGVRPGR